MYPQSETSPCHKHTMKQHTGHKASSTLPLVGASHATPANPQDASLPWRGPWWRWLTHSDLNFQPILKQDSPALNCPEGLVWSWGQEKNPTATWVSSEIIQRHETPSRSGPLETCGATLLLMAPASLTRKLSLVKGKSLAGFAKLAGRRNSDLLFCTCLHIGN